MLILDYLKKNSLEKTVSRYDLECCRHEDGRIILNYNQIKSPKLNRMVRECRALVLDKNLDLVSRSFFRFFNINETKEPFNFDDCVCYTKEDGSLINVYYWKGEFQVNTRGSFADSEVNGCGKTWKEIFTEAFPRYQELDPKYTYAFELCSPYNQVVRFYNKPTTFCLSAFEGEEELPHEHSVFGLIDELGGKQVETHQFSSQEEITEYLELLDDLTFEGFVLRDNHNNRLKFKSQNYLRLHRLANNGNVINPKNIIPLIMNNEIDEAMVYFPYIRPEAEKWSKILKKEWENLDNLWYCFYDCRSDKEFAQKIIGQTPFTHILFQARKSGKQPIDYWTPENVVKTLT